MASSASRDNQFPASKTPGKTADPATVKDLTPTGTFYTAPRARVDQRNEDPKVWGKRGSIFGGTMVEEYDDSDEREARNASKGNK